MAMQTCRQPCFQLREQHVLDGGFGVAGMQAQVHLGVGQVVAFIVVERQAQPALVLHSRAQHQHSWSTEGRVAGQAKVLLCTERSLMHTSAGQTCCWMQAVLDRMRT